MEERLLQLGAYGCVVLAISMWWNGLSWTYVCVIRLWIMYLQRIQTNILYFMLMIYYYRGMAGGERRSNL